MTILEQMIAELKTDNKLEQIMDLCSKIQEEERKNIVHPEKLPVGPNIFLSIEIPGQTKRQIDYVTLEREDEDTWIIVLYSILRKHYTISDQNPKRQKAFVINDHRPVKILTAFAKKVKYLKGE